MSTQQRWGGLRLYTTCSNVFQAESAQDFVSRVERVAAWSDAAGCSGALIYSQNRSIDPWLVSSILLACTTNLVPLVAVQPVYTHPFTVAKTVASLAFLYKRRVDLNLVAGGFEFDLLALGDRIEHDDRYERLTEFGRIVVALLTNRPVTYAGKFYDVAGLAVRPRLRDGLQPVVTVSGSSPAGARCALSVGAVAIEYPKPLESGLMVGAHEAESVSGNSRGMRIGILARGSHSEAWKEALYRFPDDSQGNLKHRAAMEFSDSHWHQQLATCDSRAGTQEADDVYWLRPFRNSQAYCPYLVGSYEEVAQYLSRYLKAGHELIILDEPRSEEDLYHSAQVFDLVST